MSAFIRGYSRGADATLMAPFDYLRLPAITAFGYLAFDPVPDARTWAGAALILGSVRALMRGESRRYGREPRPSPARESG
ncbi:MAG TPA: DMT family transporter [Gammaproteobacteria bacterium]|nr:DMT family transporter [Gammaproteobacteria bacterium]